MLKLSPLIPEKNKRYLIDKLSVLYGNQAEETYDNLVKIGISSGFKHSGFKTEKPRIIVELCSTERMDVPLIKMNQQFLSSEYLNFLTEIGNDLLMRSQKKLRRLRQILEKKIQ